jgi:hypothetical protein
MRGRKSFGSYQQFKREILSQHGGSLTHRIEDIADELYNVEISREFDRLWDRVDEDE